MTDAPRLPVAGLKLIAPGQNLHESDAEFAAAIESCVGFSEDTAHLLAQVVDVIDPATGTVRLKSKVVDADEMALDTRSTKTVRVRQ